MKRKYFNVNEFNYAMKYLETDPYLAKERFDKYLVKYPKDYYARVYYVITLTRICAFEDAEREYNRIATEVKTDSYYMHNSNRTSGFAFNMVLARIKILSAAERYQELYDLLFDNYDILENVERNYISYYCKIKLGIMEPDCHSTQYRFNQCICYSEEAFLDHMKKHFSGVVTEIGAPNQSVFRVDFPFEKVLEEIKKNIPSDKRLFEGYFNDTYYFRYDNCGTVNNSLTNYFAVVCFHNTSDILTMYPTNNCEFLPKVDLNYMIEQDEESKVKTLSRIEKFNLRYKR